MLNNIVIVGRIANNPKLIEENGHKCSYITLANNREFKNSEGIYETDFIDIKVPYPMCDVIVEYCLKGDAIGVKGRIERLPECENMIIVAERITFLSSGGGKDND